MYKHIMVLLDGSANSKVALQEAIRLAKDQGAALRLVHVLDLQWGAYGDEYAYGETMLKEARTLAEQHGVKSEAVILDANSDGIGSVIAEAARTWPAHLVVIGTHGRSGVQRLLLGSVAESVVRTSPVPVLTVNGNLSQSMVDFKSAA